MWDRFECSPGLGSGFARGYLRKGRGSNSCKDVCGAHFCLQLYFPEGKAYFCLEILLNRKGFYGSESGR